MNRPDLPFVDGRSAGRKGSWVEGQGDIQLAKFTALDAIASIRKLSLSIG